MKNLFVMAAEIVAVACVLLGLPSHTLAQNQFPDRNAIEGPWECTTPKGVAGIFLTIYTFRTSQPNVNIRVYQRQKGEEHSGNFSPSATESVTALNDNHLTIQFKGFKDSPPFDLDVRFNPAVGRWTGMWSFCENSQNAVLERPHPRDGASPNVFVGDWTASASSRVPASGSLHIRQSHDGRLTAWLDRTFAGSEQRYAEWLIPLRADEDVIVLDTAPGLPGPHYRFDGKLIEERNAIAGEWIGCHGGTLNAPTHFQRVTQ
jgi:hypothetical protein